MTVNLEIRKRGVIMKKRIKKAIVCTLLVGMAQFGLAATATTIEASPRNDWKQQQNDHQWQENNRHKQEMRRRHNENAREWNDRQWVENQRHDNTMNEIFAGLIGIAIGSTIN